MIVMYFDVSYLCYIYIALYIIFIYLIYIYSLIYRINGALLTDIFNYLYNLTLVIYLTIPIYSINTYSTYILLYTLYSYI